MPKVSGRQKWRRLQSGRSGLLLATFLTNIQTVAPRKRQKLVYCGATIRFQRILPPSFWDLVATGRYNQVDGGA